MPTDEMEDRCAYCGHPPSDHADDGEGPCSHIREDTHERCNCVAWEDPD